MDTYCALIADGLETELCPTKIIMKTGNPQWSARFEMVMLQDVQFLTVARSVDPDELTLKDLVRASVCVQHDRLATHLLGKSTSGLEYWAFYVVLTRKFVNDCV
jgi:hypothetical protein